jgi:hypothetical protein
VGDVSIGKYRADRVAKLIREISDAMIFCRRKRVILSRLSISIIHLDYMSRLLARFHGEREERIFFFRMESCSIGASLPILPKKIDESYSERDF